MSAMTPSSIAMILAKAEAMVANAARALDRVERLLGCDSSPPIAAGNAIAGVQSQAQSLVLAAVGLTVRLETLVGFIGEPEPEDVEAVPSPTVPWSSGGACGAGRASSVSPVSRMRVAGRGRR